MPGSSTPVLIIRLDAIGDALALTPLLAAFADRSIPVDVVLRPQNAGAFSSRAARRIVEATFSLRSNDRKTLEAIAALGAELAEWRYQHVLVATEDPGGYRLARATGAPDRIGFSNAKGKPFKSIWTRAFLTRRVARTAGLDPAGRHECETLFALGEPILGATEIPRSSDRLRPFVVERETASDDRVAVQITDKWERLGMHLDDVDAAIRAIAARHPVRAIASRSEAAYAKRFGELSVEFFDELEPWKEAVAGARALVAPDSGAIHVAGMTGTPVVAVFADTPQFALQRARWSPWAAPNRVLAATAGWPPRAASALDELLA